MLSRSTPPWQVAVLVISLLAVSASESSKRPKRQISFPGQQQPRNSGQRRPSSRGQQQPFISNPQQFYGSPPNNPSGNQQRPYSSNKNNGFQQYGSPQRENQGGSRGQATAQCNKGECLPPIFCKGIVAGTTLRSTAAICHLSDNSYGICCNRDLRPPVGAAGVPFAEPSKKVQIRFIDRTELNKAAQGGITSINNLIATNQRLARRNVVVRSNTPDAGHLNFFKTSARSLAIGNEALRYTEAARLLRSWYELSPDEGGFGLQRFSIRDTIINGSCSAPPVCNHGDYYRTIDGSCNNLVHTSWGQSNTGLQRILAPSYEDGIFTPRVGVGGGTLPSARRVSNIVSRNFDNPYTDITISLMTWGQFLDHDMSLSPIFRLQDSRGVECCGEDGSHLPSDLRHPQCFPIDVEPNDPFYSRKDARLRCMNFVRSLPAPRPDCNFGYAEQLNSLTHYLDASQIYGSDEEQAIALRQLHGGRLKESRPGQLPVEEDESDECFAKDLGGECYKAGDGRVNENLQLTIMHTVWLREHNRIAERLQQLAANKGRFLSDEDLYQQARRIVIAEWQHIIYHEWLPIVLGNKFMEAYGLKTKGAGYSGDYKDNINPSINNEFSTAAFRFGHTLVADMVHVFRKVSERPGALFLKDVLNNPAMMTNPSVVNGVARGFHLQNAQKFDSNIVDDLRNHLFEPPRGDHGMDLIALNIQRGREHGIPSYNEMRTMCGLKKAKRFQDLINSGEIPESIVRRFEQVYNSVNDIDLFIGGITEKPIPGALLGHTFLCIVGDQFARLKKGDRFFYDLGGQPHSFTEAQLFEIRKTSWARLLCDNMPGITQIQPLAFYVPNFFNRLTKCDSYAIPKVSFDTFA